MQSRTTAHNLASKLNHPLQEVRARAQDSLTFKLDNALLHPQDFQVSASGPSTYRCHHHSPGMQACQIIART
jgi:hypothetical protein